MIKTEIELDELDIVNQVVENLSGDMWHEEDLWIDIANKIYEKMKKYYKTEDFKKEIDEMIKSFIEEEKEEDYIKELIEERLSKNIDKLISKKISQLLKK